MFAVASFRLIVYLFISLISLWVIMWLNVTVTMQHCTVRYSTFRFTGFGIPEFGIFTRRRRCRSFAMAAIWQKIAVGDSRGPLGGQAWRCGVMTRYVRGRDIHHDHPYSVKSLPAEPSTLRPPSCTADVQLWNLRQRWFRTSTSRFFIFISRSQIVRSILAHAADDGTHRRYDFYIWILYHEDHFRHYDVIMTSCDRCPQAANILSFAPGKLQNVHYQQDWKLMEFIWWLRCQLRKFSSLSVVRLEILFTNS